MEDPLYEEFWQRDVEESIRQGNVKPFVEESALQVSNWGFSLADLKLQKKERSNNVISWLKSIFIEEQEEYIGFLGPIHIWQVSPSLLVSALLTPNRRGQLHESQFICNWNLIFFFLNHPILTKNCNHVWGYCFERLFSVFLLSCR